MSDKSGDEVKHVCGYCGNSWEPYWLPPANPACPQCRSHKKEVNARDAV